MFSMHSQASALPDCVIGASIAAGIVAATIVIFKLSKSSSVCEQHRLISAFNQWSPARCDSDRWVEQLDWVMVGWPEI